MVFRALHGLAPLYLDQLVRVVDLPGHRRLRSSSYQLHVPTYHLATAGHRSFQWRSKVGVGPCAKIPESPLVPLTGFVCVQTSNPNILGRPKVCHTSKSQKFPVISDETN